MNALYNLSILSLEMILWNRNITLNWFLLKTVDMWLSKLSLLSIVIPKISNSHFTRKENLWSVWPKIKAWCFFAFTTKLSELPGFYNCSFLQALFFQGDWSHIMYKKGKWLPLPGHHHSSQPSSFQTSFDFHLIFDFTFVS